jgi:CubicO group peptidase (beta-lactamase class C family)
MITLPGKPTPARQLANAGHRTSGTARQTVKYALVLLLLAQRLPAQPPAFVTDSLDRYVARGLADWQIPGLAVAVVKDGKVALIKGYGVREAGKPDRVDEKTLFMIGSNTKAFTATALALLESEKKLSLDDKVRKWLPAFTLHDTLAAREANLRDLLSHRVGMKTFQGDFMYWTSDMTRREVMQKFGALPPAYGFRSRFGYCNAAFLVAGEVIPAAAGVPWETFVKERILKPLGMDRTRMLAAELAGEGNLAASHTLVQGKLTKIPHPLIDNLAPAGSMSSSAREMTHWLRMQLDSGRFGGRQVVPFEALQSTRTAHTIVSSQPSSLFPRHFNLYGLGWFLQDYAGRRVITHSGGVNGFVTLTAVVPEEGLGIVVLTNTDANAFYQALYYQLLDAYLGRPYRDYHQLFWGQSREQEARDKAKLDADLAQVARKPKPALPLRSYAGSYAHPVYGDVTVKLEGGKLNLYFSRHPDLVGRLQPRDGNTFLCTYSDPTFGIHPAPFAIEGNAVKSVSVKVSDFLEYDPYVFVKK